jgi:site-specific recombinase XerC
VIYQKKLQRAFNKACELAQIDNFHFHDLRHTFASYLRQRGVDLHTIQKLLGHKDGRMTQRYAHLCVDNLRDAVSVLNQRKGAQKGAHSHIAASRLLANCLINKKKLVVPTGVEPVS